MATGFIYLGWGRKLGYNKESKYKLHLNFSIITYRHLIISLGLINIFIVIASGWFIYYYYAILNQNWAVGSDIKNIFALMNIANENTIATWYASMIFMMIGLVNLLLFANVKHKPKNNDENKTAPGWLLSSIIFSLLSADELGSIHERLGKLLFANNASPFDSKLFIAGLLLAGIIGVYLIWFYIRQFFLHRRALFFFVISLLCITPIFLFEEGWDLEMHQLLVTSADLKQIIFLSLLEEGLELFASYLLLTAFLILFIEKTLPPKAESNFTLTNIKILAQPGVFIGISFFMISIAVLGVGIVGPILEFGIKGGDSGILRNWFPAALAFIGAIFALIKWSATFNNKKYAYIILSGTLLGLSVFHGADFRYWLSVFENIPVSVIILYESLLLIGIGIFIFKIRLGSLILWQKVFLLFLFLSLLISFIKVDGEAELLDILPFVFLFPFLISLLIEKQQSIFSKTKTRIQI